MPRFSVVMATYNRGRHILPSIRSVLNQSFQDFELLVVGDCCSDDTHDVVRPLLSPQVRWFNLPERCGSQSFPNNEGISRSAGRYIAYLGHDDIWAPDHLLSLATLFENDGQLDFAVGGAIYHGPADSDYRLVTGIFTEDTAPLKHFFPPSSFAHLRDVTERIGPWQHPMEIVAPVDADLLLRAARSGMRFASTQRITVHKFAAGHRYLSYLNHESDEQEQMIEQMATPGYAAMVASEMDKSLANGTFMVATHAPYETFEKGFLAKSNAMNKGNLRPELRALTRREVIAQDNLPRALDWRPFSRGSDRIRWVDRNPRPKILLPFKCENSVRIDLTLAHSKPEALDRLGLSINGDPFDLPLSRPRKRDGAWEATAVLKTRLHPQDYSIIELELTASQRSLGQQTGIGLGTIVVRPVEASPLSRRARALAAKLWQRLAGQPRAG